LPSASPRLRHLSRQFGSGGRYIINHTLRSRHGNCLCEARACEERPTSFLDAAEMLRRGLPQAGDWRANNLSEPGRIALMQQPESTDALDRSGGRLRAQVWTSPPAFSYLGLSEQQSIQSVDLLVPQIQPRRSLLSFPLLDGSLRRGGGRMPYIEPQGHPASTPTLLTCDLGHQRSYPEPSSYPSLARWICST
jgi:hypothetical protein